jgi:hypothetical protein
VNSTGECMDNQAIIDVDEQRSRVRVLLLICGVSPVNCIYSRCYSNLGCPMDESLC